VGLDADSEFDRLNALRRYAILDTPPEGAFDRITALAAETMETPVAMVSLVDSNRVWFKSVHGPAGISEMARGPALCGAAIVHEGTYVVENASSDPRTLEHPLVTGEFGLEFYAGVPLKTHDGHQLGTLCCMDTKARGATPRQLRHLEILAAVVMDEIELRRSAAQISRLSEALADACNDLERRASFDPLTGVLARAAMLDRSSRLIERSVAGPKGVAVLLLDIDLFKAVNDQYGHAAGDRVLKEVAQRMAASCRGGDLLGRIGGEEFLAVFPDVAVEEAGIIAERLRDAVSREPIVLGPGCALAVSVSGGLRPIAAGEIGCTHGDAMAEADAALYRAKAAGRNRIAPSDGSTERGG
jgi:diguanylate cyclase (GGDEF)-like protein